jgi:hypothetical protein
MELLHRKPAFDKGYLELATQDNLKSRMRENRKYVNTAVSKSRRSGEREPRVWLTVSHSHGENEPLSRLSLSHSHGENEPFSRFKLSHNHGELEPPIWTNLSHCHAAIEPHELRRAWHALLKV